MKKIQLGIIVFLFFSINVFSQEGKQKDAMSQENRKELTPGERAGKITEWMKENLKLTEAQIGPVSDINLKYANKNEELKKSTGDRKAKLKQLKSNEKSRDNELKKILTKEQLKTYHSKKNELKKMLEEKAKEHGKGK